MIDVAISTLLVIIPVILIILVGYLAKKRNWITEQGAISISRFVFYIALPSLIIDEISSTDVKTFLDLKGPFVLAIVAVIMGMLGYITAHIKKLPPSKKGVWAQSSFRGNMAFMGIPITINALGDEGLYYCSAILAIGAPIYNTLSMTFLTLAQGDNKQNTRKELNIKILKNVFTNPLSIGIFIGILLSFVRPANLPILDITLGTLKKTTLPLALISMGGQLSFKTSLKIIPKAMIPMIYKLILSPLIGGVLLIILAAGQKDFITTMIFLASPTAILSYVMAREMKGDPVLSLNIILASTLICFITYSVILFTLGVLGIWEYKMLL